MRLKTRSFGILAAIVVLPLTSSAQQAAFVRTDQTGASIEVDASRPAGYTIPRTIYGTFLEPIGRSIYGGLWAQVLENPGFEDNLWSVAEIRKMVAAEPELERASGIGLPLPWEPLHYNQGVRYEPRWGDAANSSRSLLLMGLPQGEIGVRQKVYLPVHRVLRYTGSIYTKCVDGPCGLEISLRRRNHPDTVLAKTAAAAPGRDWERHEFALEIPAGRLAPREPADFVISVSSDTRVLLDQTFLYPAGHIDGMDPEMIALARELKTPLLRYGGNFTSGYHWRDGVGPIDRRVSKLNQPWGMPEYNHFGTDELLRFCQLIGAEPQIALNLGSGTPEEAVDWVRYVNQHWKGGSTGLLWELGNELWGDWQIGYPTMETVAARTRAFSEAVRKEDAKARLIGTGQDPDHFREWNAAQLTNPQGTFDLLSTHFVVGPEVRRRGPTTAFTALSSFALPVGLERHLREMRVQLNGRARVAFTEWLFWGDESRVPNFNNLGGAICTAGFLNTLMRVADFTPIADMTGLIEFGGIWKKRGQVYGVPAYWAFRMYSNAPATRPVSSIVRVEGYDIEQGNVRIPEIKDVPYLDVVAALDDTGKRLTLFCVNRHLERDIPAHIVLRGFAASSATARISTLRADTIYAVNEESRPETVVPEETTQELALPQFEHVFPRSSVTVLTLTKQ